MMLLKKHLLTFSVLLSVMLLTEVAVELTTKVSFKELMAKENLSDPTRPPASARTIQSVEKVVNLTLSEIKIWDTDSRAVINGKIMKVGERIGSYQLKKITESHVILVNEQGNLRLNLLSSRIDRKKL